MRAFPQSSFARRPPVRPAGLEAFDAAGAWRAPQLRRFDAHVANDCDAQTARGQVLAQAADETEPVRPRKAAAIPRARAEVAGARLWLIAASGGVILGLLSLLAALNGAS